MVEPQRDNSDELHKSDPPKVSEPRLPPGPPEARFQADKPRKVSLGWILVEGVCAFFEALIGILELLTAFIR
jgi:hypothetical protein